MICNVVGKSKRPYEMQDNQGKTRTGVSCRLSLHVGKYETDELAGAVGDGEQYIELRCPESIVEQVNIGDVISIDLDDKKTRIKSAMLQVDNGGFMPI